MKILIYIYNYRRYVYVYMVENLPIWRNTLSNNIHS